MATLYELTDRYQSLLELACDTSDDEGAIAPEFAVMLASLEGDINTKLAGCWRVLKTLAAERDVFAAEAARMRKRADAIERHHDNIKAFVKDAMLSLGMLKWQGGVEKFRIQDNSQPTVFVTDAAAVPADCYVTPEPQLDKQFILEAFKAGKDVPGCELQRGCHLRIV